MSDTDYKLRSIADWPRWVIGFRSQALDSKVWDNIDPEATPEGPVPWLDMPADNASNGTWRAYDRQVTGRASVRTWTRNHLSAPLLSRCERTQSSDPAVWYTTLVNHLNINPGAIFGVLLNKFDAAMTSMSSRPREASKLPDWINNWLTTMIECRDEGISYALDVNNWLPKLGKNINNVLPHWYGTFVSANSFAIVTGVLTFETVASDLRLHIADLVDTGTAMVNNRQRRSRGGNRGRRGRGRGRRQLQWQQLQRPAHS